MRAMVPPVHPEEHDWYSFIKGVICWPGGAMSWPWAFLDSFNFKA